MKRTLLVILAASVAALGGAIATTAQRQKAPKPLVAEPSIVDRAAPPATLEELGDVDLVARVRIVRATARERSLGEGYVVRETVYTAEVQDAGRMRRQLPATRQIEIVMPGGDFEEADVIRRFGDPDNPPLEAGARYLLALRWNALIDAYVLPFGPDSVFELVNDRIEPRGRGLAAQQLKGRFGAEGMNKISGK